MIEFLQIVALSALIGVSLGILIGKIEMALRNRFGRRK